MNWESIKKAFCLALRGRLWLVPVDSREEAGLSINKNGSIMLMYPDHKYLDSEKNQHGVEATLLGHYMMHTAANIGKGETKKNFEKWFKSHFNTNKKGKK